MKKRYDKDRPFRLDFAAAITAEQAEGGPRTLSGRAAVYGIAREDFKEWGLELIMQAGCFSDSLSDPAVRCLYAHDNAKMLGSIRGGNLALEDRPDGLYFSVTLPDTATANEVYTLVRHGHVWGCSFGASVKESELEGEKGEMTERVTKARLHEVSIVAFPAYEGTSVRIAAAKQFAAEAAASLPPVHNAEARAAVRGLRKAALA